MDAIRHRAICLNLATHIESQGKGHSVVFHSTVSVQCVCVRAAQHTTDQNMFIFCLFIPQDDQVVPEIATSQKNL